MYSMYFEMELNIKGHFKKGGGGLGLLLTWLREVKAGVKGGLVYLVLLEMQEVSCRHLHWWRGALGSPLPGPALHAGSSILTGWSVARRLRPRFLHHDLKTWEKRENRDREEQLLKHAAMRSHVNSGPNYKHLSYPSHTISLLLQVSLLVCASPCLVCLLACSICSEANAHALTDSFSAE